MTTVIATCTDTLSAVESPHPHLRHTSSFGSNGKSDEASEGQQGTKIALTTRQEPFSWVANLSSRSPKSSMPASTGSQSLLASLPSFMSVFGDGPGNPTYKEAGATATVTTANTTTQQNTNRPTGIAKRPSSAHQTYPSAFRRDSTSTFESVESSPTTTVSTVESSLTEPSPSSSPESPKCFLPLTSYKSYRTNSSPIVHSIMESKEQFSSSFPLLPGVERIESPHKKMRNTKNLSVNTSMSNRQGSQATKTVLSNTSPAPAGHASSAPPTPAFIVPPKAPRKNPSNLGLTITTPDSGPSSSLGQERPTLVPQTPSDPSLRSLRLLQKASSGPLFSPTHAPEGGMRLPPISNNGNPPISSRFGKSSRPPLSVSPLSSFDNTISSPITKQTLDHVQEECDYELPLSQEVKSPAYPQGPVCIYDPNVFLYLEPTDVEARAFDVVFNVAREVKNPFDAAAANPLQETPRITPMPDVAKSSLAGRDHVLEPGKVLPDLSSQPTSDVQIEDATISTPNTPKANQPDPEYIHVPWDHNTNVVDDLLRLCKVIDDRVRQGKRVLIHCQCGVSRSASLVVAYGIYQNPQLTVQEAYDAVKNRSRWIGPNMNLIYQLSEFKTKLARSNLSVIPSWHSWRSQDSSGPSMLSPLSTNGYPHSASLLPPKSLGAPTSTEQATSTGRANSFSSSGPIHLEVRSIAGDITPGPSSAPLHMFSPSPAQSGESATAPISADVKTAEQTSFPGLMELDTNLSLSPATPTAEAIREKESPPAGAVANDLQEIAKDLKERSTPEPRTDSPPANSMEIDGQQSAIATKAFVQAPEAVWAPKSTVSDLPGGFSSLLARRQGLHQLPVRQVLPTFQPPRPAALPSFNSIMHDDVPPTPSLLSPRAAEFTASPFHRTSAGDLAGSSIFEQGLTSPRIIDEDPRSPHQRGEAPITRSILDVFDTQKAPR